AAQADVRVAAGERIEKEMLSFARVELFDQQRLRRRYPRELHLRLEHGPRGLHLGGDEIALDGIGEHVYHRVGKLARQRHLGTGPADHRRLAAVGTLDVAGHLLGANELERAPGEDEAVALAQARDEALLDDADA